MQEVKQESRHTQMTYKESDGDRWTRGAGVIWRLLTGVWVVARHLMEVEDFFILIFLCTHCNSGPRGGPYLSSCCKLWSVEGQQY